MRFVVIILNLALLSVPLYMWAHPEPALLLVLAIGAVTLATPLFSISFLYRVSDRKGVRGFLRNFLMGANIIYVLVILFDWMDAVPENQLVITDMPTATIIVIGSFTTIVLLLNIVSALVLRDTPRRTGDAPTRDLGAQD